MAELDIKRTSPAIDLVGFRLSWGAIFAGFVIATVLQIVLSVLGLAIGFTSWDPRTEGLGGFGIGAAVWFVATAIVSLFVGGLVLGRLAGILRTKDGALHGAVLWGLSTLLAVWMVANGVGALLGSTLDTLTRTTSAVVSGAVSATGSIGSAVATRPGGAPPVTQRVQNAMDTVQARMQAQAAQLPPADSLRAQAANVGETTTNAVASVAWVALATMVLSLGAAVWGAGITAKS
jgi:hypothetical protein